MHALKLLAALAIGTGTLTAGTLFAVADSPEPPARPPACKASCAKGVPVQSRRGAKLFKNVSVRKATKADCPCAPGVCTDDCTGPGSPCCEANACCEKTACCPTAECCPGSDCCEKTDDDTTPACCEAAGCCEQTAAAPCLSDVEKEIAAALQRPITLHFQSAPLGKVLRDVATAADFNIWLDPVALTTCGIDIEEPITCHANGIRLVSALNLVLEPLGLQHAVSDDVCMITLAKTACCPSADCCPGSDCCEKTAAGETPACCEEAGCCEKTACCPTADCCPTTACCSDAKPSDCCEEAGCCVKVAAVAAPAPTCGPAATCDSPLPRTAVVVCRGESVSPPPAPKRLTACGAGACPTTACPECPPCGTGSACTATTCLERARTALTECTACPPVCSVLCGDSVCCEGACCDLLDIEAGCCPLKTLSVSISGCLTKALNSVCEPVADCFGVYADPPKGIDFYADPPKEIDFEFHFIEAGSCEPNSCDAAPALAAPYPIAYEPAGLYGVTRTAAVSPAPAVAPASAVAPAAYAAPAPAAALPVGRWTRKLNDQSVTIAVAADGKFTATCTVPDWNCSLECTGDCRATADGLLFGVVTSARALPKRGEDGKAADPVACVQVESFCQTLVDQPFSARCRVTNGSAKPAMTVSHALFGGIGFVGTPAPGEPAHLALTMFSGAYEAE